MEHFGCLQVQVILMYSTSVSYFVGQMLFHFLSRVGKDKWEKIKENEREEVEKEGTAYVYQGVFLREHQVICS